MSNTAPSRADPVVVFALSQWCPPQETSQPHPPQCRLQKATLKIHTCQVTLDISGLLEYPGAWFNIKMLYYQYRKSHCEDKTILRSSYLHNRISYTGKRTYLYWIRAQGDLTGMKLCRTIQFSMMSVSFMPGEWRPKSQAFINHVIDPLTFLYCYTAMIGYTNLWPDSISRCHLTSKGNPVVEIRRS